MKRNELKGITTFFIFLSVIAIAGCSNIQNNAIKNSNIKNNNNGFKTIGTGSTQMNGVLIELTPAGTKDGKFVVNFAANTHSVDLSKFDLMRITTLEYDGKQSKPSSAPKLSGHHSSGILIFNVEKELKSFKIIIKGIPNIDERVFKWT